MRFKHILITSFSLTVLIFLIGILINYGLDFVRIDAITDRIAEHELDREAYLIENDFSENFGADNCKAITSKISALKEEIKEVGLDLGSYGKTSFFKKKDYDYLKRKYFLLELRFLLNVNKVNDECGESYFPILFFYGIESDVSERQGVILEDAGKKNSRIIVLSIDKDYKDEPLVQLLVSRYGITKAPSIVLGGVKKEGLLYEAEIMQLIEEEASSSDKYGKQYNFTYVIDASGADKQSMLDYLEKISQRNLSNFARGDVLLVLGRLTGNNTLICSSINYYSKFDTKNKEETALLYETIASLECNNNKKELLLNASKLWRGAGNDFRAEVDEKLANSKELQLNFETSGVSSSLFIPDEFSEIEIGATSIVLRKEDLILSQVDRVYRDWLGHQLEQSPFTGRVLSTFSERLYLNESELLPLIGWHEGGRIKEIKKIGLNHITAVGTLAAKKGEKWYAVDDKGVFSFEVPIDKILYPTTRFLRDDLAVLIDTHGVNMLVEQSIRNKVDAVVSDCDHPGKIKAAKYLSNKGIAVICFPDKELYLALGNNLEVVGSPPIKIEGEKAVVGSRPLSFNLSEKIVVMDAAEDKYALWYYQTPASYFRELERYINLNAEYVTINDFNKMQEFISEAESLGAVVVGARVFNSNDYSYLKEWLDKDKSHRAVLFHSASYPYGYKILKEFPNQTTFGDVNLKFR